ncbi:hypothetical protein [Pseudomonas sp. 6D_7.1_Bac1]|uniref:hypothetical protein n=1 Tax=Pseudomonas sp. 6D_7.1_Bac1 TaxID=2971615 RepID=UPI0021C58E2C|nr:hypothetical protein [Pseudomonas sp. 6D_7.1_Bac1]MCU1750075.1 hypothetical protein [Pseudomonas sp. 6D_7.1_Bac1]
MVDPITVSTGAAAAAYLSKDGVAKLLGPTADYLGGELKSLVEKSQKNLGAIFKSATSKAGDKLSEPGVVNARVLKHVIDEGRFTEEALFAEYFGGVLASARTPDGVDDRGVYYAQIVQSMSVYQLRMHYLFYYLMWNLAKGRQLDLNSYVDRCKLELVLPARVYERTFGVVDGRKEMSFIVHGLSGLSREDLIEESWQFDNPKVLKASHIEVDSHAFCVAPTIAGIELFIWAHGMGEQGLRAFLDPQLVEKDELGIEFKELARFKTQMETQLTGRGI